MIRCDAHQSLLSRFRLAVESASQHLVCVHATHPNDKLLLHSSSRTLSIHTHIGVDGRKVLPSTPTGEWTQVRLETAALSFFVWVVRSVEERRQVVEESRLDKLDERYEKCGEGDCPCLAFMDLGCRQAFLVYGTSYGADEYGK